MLICVGSRPKWTATNQPNGPHFGGCLVEFFVIASAINNYMSYFTTYRIIMMREVLKCDRRWSNIEVTPNNSIKSSPILPSRGWVIGDNDHQYLHDISHNLSHNNHDDARSAILWPVLVQGWREYQQLNPIGLQSAAVRIIFSCYFGHQYIHAIFYHLSHYRVDYARGVTLLPESAQSLGEYQKLIQIGLHYAALLNLFSVFNSAIKYKLYCTTYYIIIGLYDTC